MSDDNKFESVTTYGRLKHLLAKDTPVLLNAFGAGCEICMSTEAEAKIAARYGKKIITLVKMSVDEVPELDSELGIDTIPTVLLFKDGKDGTRRKFPSNPDADGAKVSSWLEGELNGTTTTTPP